ncbi:hypothetical protein CFOL_v3_23957, partial [Cephalotus follicularis]
MFLCIDFEVVVKPDQFYCFNCGSLRVEPTIQNIFLIGAIADIVRHTNNEYLNFVKFSELVLFSRFKKRLYAYDLYVFKKKFKTIFVQSRRGLHIGGLPRGCHVRLGK